MSKVNLRILPLFAVFAFVCSCSSGGSSDEQPEDSSSSSENEVQKYEWCSYDEHEICLKGPFKACPGTGGELLDECEFAAPVTPSSSSGGVTGETLYCVYDEYEMCFEVFGANIDCPSPMKPKAQKDCPYETKGTSDIDDPVGNGGLLNFVYDYGDNLYVGSTVSVINDVEVENYGYDKARCYIPATKSEVAYNPASMVDEATGRLIGVGTITLRAVATCAGIRVVIDSVIASVVIAPPPDTSGVIQFKEAGYAALAGGVVTLDNVENGITISNSAAAQCGAVETIMINTGRGMPGTTVEAAAFAVCRGEFVTLGTATANVVYAEPVAGGTLTFNAAPYAAGTVVTAANVTNNVTVTNPVQSGCDLDSRTVEVENVPVDERVIPPGTTGVIPGKVKAQAYFVCNEGQKKAVGASSDTTVNAIAPTIDGSISISTNGVITASTSRADIITTNVVNAVDFTNSVYTSCPDAAVNKQIIVFVGSTTTQRANDVLPKDSIVAQASLNCGSYNPTIRSQDYVLAEPISILLNGTVSISEPVTAGKLISEISISSTIGSNAIYTECPTAVVQRQILVNDAPELGAYRLLPGNKISVRETISCGIKDDSRLSNIVTVVPVAPIFTAGTVKFSKSTYEIGEDVTALITGITIENADVSDCGIVDFEITGEGYDVATGKATAPGTLTVRAYAECNGSREYSGDTDNAHVGHDPEKEGTTTFSKSTYEVGENIVILTKVTISNPTESHCEETQVKITGNVEGVYDEENEKATAPGTLTAQAYAKCNGIEKSFGDPALATVVYAKPLFSTGQTKFKTEKESYTVGDKVETETTITITNKSDANCEDLKIMVTGNAEGVYDEEDEKATAPGTLTAQAYAKCNNETIDAGEPISIDVVAEEEEEEECEEEGEDC